MNVNGKDATPRFPFLVVPLRPQLGDPDAQRSPQERADVVAIDDEAFGRRRELEVRRGRPSNQIKKESWGRIFTIDIHASPE